VKIPGAKVIFSGLKTDPEIRDIVDFLRQSAVYRNKYEFFGRELAAKALMD
jgi:hypothetical protein